MNRQTQLQLIQEGIETGLLELFSCPMNASNVFVSFTQPLPSLNIDAHGYYFEKRQMVISYLLDHMKWVRGGDPKQIKTIAREKVVHRLLLYK